MTKIAVIGASGRMGSKILGLLKNDKSAEITGAIDSAQNQCQGQKVFADLDVIYSSDVNVISGKSQVFIDFSAPDATIENLKILRKLKKNIVIGTTGFTNEQVNLIHDAAKEIGVVFSPNMSVGVNVFFKILNDAAKFLKDYDTEIVEIHHNKKKDAPSGTALKLAEIVTKATERRKEDWIFGREGNVGARKNEEIAIHAVRLGDVVGEHSVYFCGNDERLELTHRAHSRDNFAKGAILAAKWLENRTAGLYDMFDVLGLK